jgi:hypothetical protein
MIRWRSVPRWRRWLVYLGLGAITALGLLIAGDGRYLAATVCLGYGVVSTILLVVLLRAPADESWDT